MPLVEFSDSDLMRNRVVPPAWYVLDLQTVGEWSPTKNKDSNNCLFETVIIRNADNGSTDEAGVPITLQFNDKPKAKPFLEGFFRALGVDVTAGRYELKNAEGKTIEALVENEMWEGRIRNRCNHKYRKPRS